MRIDTFVPTEAVFYDGTEVSGETEGAMFMCLPFTGKGYETLPATHGYYPIEIPMEKALEWWWRVKTWEVVITQDTDFTTTDPDANIITSADGTYGANVPFQIQAASPGSHSITKELCAVCDSNFDADVFLPYTLYDGEVGYAQTDANYYGTQNLRMSCTFHFMARMSVTEGLSELNTNDYPFYKVKNLECNPSGMIQPLIAIQLFVAYYPPGTPAPGEYAFNFIQTHPHTPGLDDVQDCTGTVTLDGYEIPAFAWRIQDDGGSPVNSFSVSITPKTWWPYDDADGNNPIWDASTGAQLRSVVTGETI